MGVGTPEDLVEGVARGIDIFDCVLPTRVARNGQALLAHGQAQHAQRPVRRGPGAHRRDCALLHVPHFSRAYIRHLVVAKEMLGATLLTDPQPPHDAVADQGYPSGDPGVTIRRFPRGLLGSRRGAGLSRQLGAAHAEADSAVNG